MRIFKFPDPIPEPSEPHLQKIMVLSTDIGRFAQSKSTEAELSPLDTFYAMGFTLGRLLAREGFDFITQDMCWSVSIGGLRSALEEGFRTERAMGARGVPPLTRS